MDEPANYGARVRAARCYANIDQDELAKTLEISVSTLARLESGVRPLTIPEARKIAEKTGVPLTFLLEGFGIYEERRITEPPKGSGIQRPPAPRGRLAQRLSDLRTSREDRPRTWRPQEGDTRQDDAG